MRRPAKPRRIAGSGKSLLQIGDLPKVMSAEPETETHDSQAASRANPSGGSRSRKRGGCLRSAFLLLLLGVPVLLFLLNGPVARWAAEFAIGKAAESQELSGSVTVKGSLLSGFMLTDGRFEGSTAAPVESLALEKLDISYDPWKWIEEGGLSGLREITLRGLSARLVLRESIETEASAVEESPEAQSPASALDAALIEQLLAVRYAIEDLDLVIETPAKAIYEIENLDLRLEPGGQGRLSFGRLVIPEQAPWKEVETALHLTADSLTLGPLPLFEAIEIETLHVQLPRDSEPIATTRLVAYGARLEASYGSGNAIEASLTGGALPVSEILRWYPVEGLEVGDVTALDLDFTGDFLAPESWKGLVSLSVSEAAWQGHRAEGIEIECLLDPTAGAEETLSLEVDGAGLHLDAGARFSLEGISTTRDLARVAAQVDADVNVSSVEQVLQSYLPDHAETIPVTGTLEGSVSLAIADERLKRTDAHFASSTLAYDTIPVDSLSLDAELRNEGPLRFESAMTLEEGSALEASGSFDLDTRAYEGKASTTLDLGERLSDLLTRLGHEIDLGGQVALSWAGNGSLDEETSFHRGSVAVDSRRIRFGGAQPFDAAFDGTYRDRDIDLSRLTLVSEEFQVEGALSWEREYLEIPRFSMHSGDLLLLQGEIRSPLQQAVFSDPMQYFAQDGEIEIDLHSHDLALGSVLGLVNQSPPVECRLNLDLEASGTPSDLRLEATLLADDIAARKGIHELLDDQVAPAKANLTVSVKDAVATLSGQVDQPQIEPFTLAGTMPFHPTQWLDGSRSPLEETATASARMEPSSLAVILPFVPALKTIDGEMAIDVSLDGPLGSPNLEGQSSLLVRSLHFETPAAPTVRDLEATLRFAERAIHVDTFRGVFAGGQIGMKGRVNLPEGGKPEFDLRLGGHEVLVFRSDSVSARTDLDLRLQGPFPAAHLAGTIGITSSLFYKDFDLLPIEGLPGGREKSSLPEVDPGPRMPLPKSLDVGVPIAPFEDWTVDLEVVTLDPFRVAGNLAQADIESDLGISGTLGAPIPKGRIWIETGRLVLPFSKIDLSDAEVRFDETTGFNGILGLRARSKVGDYWVSIFAQNRLLAPEIVFTSVPPLPREDILSLLSSGATRDQLTDGGGTAATKAALYYLKSLRNKEGRIDPDAPPSFADTLEERTSVSVGKTNPDTGEMEIDATIRLWRESYLGFSIGQEGSYRGVLKYLFRFR